MAFVWLCNTPYVAAICATSSDDKRCILSLPRSNTRETTTRQRKLHKCETFVEFSLLSVILMMQVSEINLVGLHLACILRELFFEMSQRYFSITETREMFGW